MNHDRNVEGLRQNAYRKRLEAIEKTEKGIQKLLQEGKSINFKAVAEAAEVSTAWLYKEPVIKERIQILRDQNTKKKKQYSLKCQTFNDEICADIIVVIDKAVNKIETKNMDWDECTRCIKQISTQIAELDEQIHSLKIENLKLKKQIAYIASEMNQNI
ncbi:DUF6262 family protein [Nostoc sp. MG11]|uniref:DUF6262 family protein n=1 Tax=Nostoc sp. MG11 TaxID=2721166 RepID=UPI001867CBFB|nr:DUF6262 family protein [Nostoc sp. MG11]